MDLKALTRRDNDGIDELHVCWSVEQIDRNPDAWVSYTDDLKQAVANGDIAGYAEVDLSIVKQSLTAGVKRAAKPTRNSRRGTKG